MNAADRCGAGRARLIAGRRARRPLLAGGFFALLLGTLSAAPAAAAPISVGPGETYVLTADVALAPTDTFMAQGTEGAPCTIVGAGFSVTAMDFKGTFVISHCLVRGLGTDKKVAIDIRMLGTASFRVEDSTFSQSGQIYVLSNEDTSVSILRSDFLEDAVVVADIDTILANSSPAIKVEGMSSTTKQFKSNRVLKSFLNLLNTQHWQVGGLTEAEGNIFYGLRGGIYAENVKSVQIQGNYLRTPFPWSKWNQLTSLSFYGDDSDVIVEHNLIRGGNGLVFGAFAGELRYNILADPHAAFWINGVLGKVATKVHHNLLLRSEAVEVDANYWRMIGLEVQHNNNDMLPTADPQLEFYNNTMDTADCYNPPGAGVGVSDLEIIKSIRNNVFTRMSYSTAAVDAYNYALQTLEKPADPGPARMLYADYNDFFNLHPPLIDNYALSVAGKNERTDDGFGAHDLGNKDLKNQQTDPVLTGPLPIVFPFSDDDLSSRAVTVCQVLAYYRKLYTPIEGKSPLIDAADPADGPGADIGAIGAGAPHPDDLFGTVCPADISALKPPSGDMLKCPVPTPTGDPSSTPKSPPGWLCVCTVAAPPRAVDLLPLIGLVGIALSRSRRRVHRR